MWLDGSHTCVVKVSAFSYSVYMATNLDELNAQSAYAPLPPIFAKLGLAYDDVLLLPNETDVIPSEVDTSTHLTRNITMKAPVLSANCSSIEGTGISNSS